MIPITFVTSGKQDKHPTSEKKNAMFINLQCAVCRKISSSLAPFNSAAIPLYGIIVLLHRTVNDPNGSFAVEVIRERTFAVLHL